MKTSTSAVSSIKKTASRYEVFGFPVVRVIRTLGKNGFTFQEAKKALEDQHVKPAEATIRINLSKGRWTRKGAKTLAPLTEAQLDEFRSSISEMVTS